MSNQKIHKSLKINQLGKMTIDNQLVMYSGNKYIKKVLELRKNLRTFPILLRIFINKNLMVYRSTKQLLCQN